jgi:hypothetical protein
MRKRILSSQCPQKTRHGSSLNPGHKPAQASVPAGPWVFFVEEWPLAGQFGPQLTAGNLLILSNFAAPFFPCAVLGSGAISLKKL